MITKLPSRIGARRYNILDMTHDERRTYFIWKDINNRTSNPGCAAYIHYGGRGIKLSQEFRESFELFFEHIGPPPSRQHSVDRIDNNGNYERGNLRWATKYYQMRNRRCTIMETWHGKTQCLADWAKELEINAVTLWGRYQKGLRGDELFAKPTNRGRQAHYDDIPGIGFKSLRELSVITGIGHQTLIARYLKGWRGLDLIKSVEQACHEGALKRAEIERQKKKEVSREG